jgi:hypothetical protein
MTERAPAAQDHTHPKSPSAPQGDAGAGSAVRKELEMLRLEGDKRPWNLPPLVASQGGIVFNHKHIEFWKHAHDMACAEITRLRAREAKPTLRPEDVRKALAQQGFAIVPMEPTPDMRIKGGIAWSEAMDTAETYVDTADACYKAMLGAAEPAAIRALDLTQPPSPAEGGESLPPDVSRLVIAARVVAFEDQGPEALKELDKASEAFAARVPWEE